MTKPKVGDRVRIVIEDTVEQIFSSGGCAVVAGDSYLIGRYGVVSIEVIPEPFVLPTKRWAQVADSQNFLWTRVHPEDEPHPHYQWVSLGGKCVPSWQLLKSSGLRVISEGVEDE